MDLSIILSVTAGVGYVLAYLDYNRSVFKGTTKPNGATWAVWSTIAVVSTTSYLSATGDFWKSVIPILNIVCCTGTFVLASIAGKFSRLHASDWIAFGIGSLAAAGWGAYRSAAFANAIIQFAVLAGFFPTWRAILRAPLSEYRRPWWIWGASYCISTIVVILRWKNQWIDLVYPVNCVLLHASVPIICKLKIAVDRAWSPNEAASSAGS